MPRRRTHTGRRLALAAGLVLLGLGAWQLGGAATLHAKAWLAQILLARAWNESLSDHRPHKPWPWADTAPIARLKVPALDIDRIVLSGASGRTLAFGPGHLSETAWPGAAGHSVVAGHRDTHFRFLQDLTPAMDMEVQSSDGVWRHYRVTGSKVIDARGARLMPAASRPTLTLVTCWPFDAIEPGGPLRYAVFAEGYIPPAP